MRPWFMGLSRLMSGVAILLSAGTVGLATETRDVPSAAFGAFLQKNCFECHDAETKKGGLDLSSLKFDLSSLVGSKNSNLPRARAT